MNVWLVGNGAVTNGWAPVRRAMLKVGHKVPPEDENFVFAEWVFLGRWLAKKAKDPKQPGPRRHKLQQKLEWWRNEMRRLRDAISRELELAEREGEVTLRPHVSAVARQFPPAAVITTNWDMTLAPFVQGWQADLVSLHGDRRRSNILYLPTETIEEPYREDDDHEELGSRVGRAMRLLQDATDLVVFGLSLSPLDAELSVAVRDGFHGTDNPKRVRVIDANPNPVVGRLRYLLSDRIVGVAVGVPAAFDADRPSESVVGGGSRVGYDDR